jgi:hypothetical protein
MRFTHISYRTEASYLHYIYRLHPVLRQAFTEHNLAHSILHRAGGSASHAGRDVAVCVQREGYADMSQKLLDVLGVYASAEDSMAQVCRRS